MECNGQLSEGLSNGFKVERAWCQSPIHDVKGVLTQVRSRLLDFALELKEQFGDIDDGESMKEKAANFDATGLFKNAIFGSNTTILPGHHNSQQVHGASVTNDLGALISQLSALGVPLDEVEKLKEAVEADQAAEGKASFDGETGRWLTGLLSRAAKGGLSVGIDVVSSTVSKLLTNYMTGGTA